jgi:anti-sigma B factor antagonist
MPQLAVTMTVRPVSDGISIIDIAGDITAGCEAVLMDAYSQASTGRAEERVRPGAIILNFSGLEYMNSGGIGLLVTLLVRANRQHQRLLVYGVNEHYRQIFELTRLDEAIDIRTTEAEAVAAASR